jgi:plastocyanin
VIVAAVVTGAAALGASQALAASEPITTTTLCCSFGKSAFTIDEGTVATFQNSDPGTSPHDVTSIIRRGPKPLFASAVIGLGETPVSGTERLGPGSYRFFCTIHPTQMSGQLVVAGSGIPPSVKLLSGNLGKVVSKRKLVVKLRASTVSNDVSLTAQLGKKKLGSQSGIAIAAGATRTVALRLTRSGRNLLDDLEAAKVKVTATVSGGKPATATRRLR